MPTLELIAELQAAQAALDRHRLFLIDADDVARQRGDRYGLCDAIDRDGQPYPSQSLADLIRDARSKHGRPEAV